MYLFLAGILIYPLVVLGLAHPENNVVSVVIFAAIGVYIPPILFLFGFLGVRPNWTKSWGIRFFPNLLAFGNHLILIFGNYNWISPT